MTAMPKPFTIRSISGKTLGTVYAPDQARATAQACIVYPGEAHGLTASEPVAREIIEQQLRDRSRRIIRADGRIEPVPQPTNSMEAVEKMIDTDGVDTVNLHHLGRPLMVMAVTDRGYETRSVEHPEAPQAHLGGLTASVTEMVPTRALKPINEIATAMYHANCVPGTTHQIVGDVYICPDEDFA